MSKGRAVAWASGTGREEATTPSATKGRVCCAEDPTCSDICMDSRTPGGTHLEARSREKAHTGAWGGMETQVLRESPRWSIPGHAHRALQTWVPDHLQPVKRPVR